jgi:hypothetical protein
MKKKLGTTDFGSHAKENFTEEHKEIQKELKRLRLRK